ncbi:splicing factor Cactin-like [Mercenaria mercenaria]|uniref:splicing factor Cactin-like n=1 Tax=Mercenaria mercenaria TaxID=6596 RepID=UPI00234EDBB9|nr:splicing factor Cactin-like [Mercenaria mercenaria]
MGSSNGMKRAAQGDKNFQCNERAMKWVALKIFPTGKCRGDGAQWGCSGGTRRLKYGDTKVWITDSESSEDNEFTTQREESSAIKKVRPIHQGFRTQFTGFRKFTQEFTRSQRIHKRTQRYNHSDSSQESRSPSDSRERKRKKDKKKKKHRSRSRSPVVRKKKRREKSSESSETDDDSRDRGKMSRSSRLSQEEVDKMREEMRRRKEIIKATEAPEEKRARRLAKKEAKERKRREKSGWDQEYMGYTNVDNPFGDEHLTETFVWSKKISKEGKEALDHEEIHQMTKKKMEETRVYNKIKLLIYSQLREKQCLAVKGRWLLKTR